MNTNGSEPAFPVPNFHRADGCTEYGYNGQTKREHIATACLQGLLSSPEFYATLINNHPDTGPEIAALEAVKFADALLLRLAK